MPVTVIAATLGLVMQASDFFRRPVKESMIAVQICGFLHGLH